MQAIIKARDLAKQYFIGGPTAAYSTLRERLTELARVPLNSFRKNSKSPQIWALQDISFDINPGEVVGIIGRNGAGKSTLLKVLSRITEPTKGRVELFGRVASLLEVGTGFHPELSGRENIFLNGSILGMTRKEIEAKFDEIVAFSEVEKFIDTPVKRYSSGMYVRLAFAVAAHLEPEILVVDEVLAVGDAAFQKKCLGRMHDVAKEGRTVLFVSHNMAAVSALCTSAMVLAHGKVDHPIGDVQMAVQKYLSQVNELTKANLAERTDRQGEGKVRLINFALFDQSGNEIDFISSGQEVVLRIFYLCPDGAPVNVTVAIGITSHAGAFVSMLSNQISGSEFPTIAREGFFDCRIKKLPLSPGIYTVNLIVRSNDIIQDWIQEAVTVTVEPGDFFGTGRMPPQSHSGVLIEQDWSSNL